ncbi:MAG: hypothetical protein F4110_04135 [Acidimicrobiaceae bacterium]|nr:hypothetical protein [Acidimicrobiaceae bacterium]MYE97136.1 hypothetical protein [Acidimicrobiaceae bacterium]MYI53162.1 hypothetical protein [Acidimicrobiaceae bacterium]
MDLQGAGFCIAARHRTSLRARPLEAVRTEFWRRHEIIDALDADIAEASIVGITAAFDRYRLATAAEADEEFKAASPQYQRRRRGPGRLGVEVAWSEGR